ncbi:MerR family transcriptional regulator [Boseaceae bacterium BT-24-1]|nr:MerR family transcriptional regulator [Boseaceae bacterium BT-24-1]
MKTYSITDLAREFGVTLRTLRFYESRGLLTPARSGVQRIYSEAHRERFRQIHAWAQQGFTLREIKRALIKGGFDRRQIARQIAELKQRRDDTERAIAQLEREVAA